MHRPRIRNNTHHNKQKASWEKITKHHLLCTSRDWTSVPENILKIKARVHRAFHIIFDNATIPEQFEILLQINESAIQWDFAEDIRRILEIYWEDVYHCGVKRNKK